MDLWFTAQPSPSGYTAVVLIGALATPGCSHVGEHVSTLYQSGAPNGMWIAALFAVYNLLILAFGVGVFRMVSNRGGGRCRKGQAGGVALVLTAIAGFMDVVFRQDPIGSRGTTAGTRPDRRRRHGAPLAEDGFARAQRCERNRLSVRRFRSHRW